MSFTFNLGTSIGQVRNVIGDVDSTSYLLSDEEINSFLSMKSGDVFAAASMCCRRIMANKALLAKTVRAGNYSESTSDIAKFYRDLANDLDEMSKNIPASASGEVIYTDFNYNQLVQDKVHRGESLDS